MNNPPATALASALWGPLPSANLQPKDLKPFLSYYRRQLTHPSLNTCLDSLPSLSQLTALIATDTPRDTILATLQSNHPTSPLESLQDSLDLAARLLVLVPFGDWDVPADTKTTTLPTWEALSSLREALTSLFPPSPPPRDDADPALAFDPTFNAFALHTDAGIAIVFTDNLAEHLRLVTVDARGNKALMVFHHATVLGAASALLPAGLAAETLRTLALLFPRAEFASASRLTRHKKERWLKHVVIDRWEDAAGGGRTVDGGVARCEALGGGGRRVEGFRFWRERLVALKEAYDGSVGLGSWAGRERAGEDWARFAGMAPMTVPGV
ncbi:hypothetical protein QBC39DRAFT_412007 [Podospora conica]|nr:hypothetical protein QBC39DRAFT_412007 [Schizothecium conicum]